ncbi:unnamed protein product [Moneuplotes crassus]|uniref:Myb-like domain-containing protein n=1 Tax=Euplotes crassus TaxID=5936 RepID=A0AAD1UIK4_EUPCR|nr:unnamed protein product [Moneuplotes crassus]
MKNRKQAWSVEETEKLYEVTVKCSSNVNEILKYFPGRSKFAVKKKLQNCRKEFEKRKKQDRKRMEQVERLVEEAEGGEIEQRGLKEKMDEVKQQIEQKQIQKRQAQLQQQAQQQKIQKQQQIQQKQIQQQQIQQQQIQQQQIQQQTKLQQYQNVKSLSGVQQTEYASVNSGPSPQSQSVLNPPTWTKQKEEDLCNEIFSIAGASLPKIYSNFNEFDANEVFKKFLEIKRRCESHKKQDESESASIPLNQANISQSVIQNQPLRAIENIPSAPVISHPTQSQSKNPPKRSKSSPRLPKPSIQPKPKLSKKITPKVQKTLKQLKRSQTPSPAPTTQIQQLSSQDNLPNLQKLVSLLQNCEDDTQKQLLVHSLQNIALGVTGEQTNLLQDLVKVQNSEAEKPLPMNKKRSRTSAKGKKSQSDSREPQKQSISSLEDSKKQQTKRKANKRQNKAADKEEESKLDFFNPPMLGDCQSAQDPKELVCLDEEPVVDEDPKKVAKIDPKSLSLGENWTHDLQTQLFQIYKELGEDWEGISKILQIFGPKEVKDRFFALCRERAKIYRDYANSLPKNSKKINRKYFCRNPNKAKKNILLKFADLLMKDFGVESDSYDSESLPQTLEEENEQECEKLISEGINFNLDSMNEEEFKNAMSLISSINTAQKKKLEKSMKRKSGISLPQKPQTPLELSSGDEENITDQQALNNIQANKEFLAKILQKFLFSIFF